jgi:hypothetical protein
LDSEPIGLLKRLEEGDNLFDVIPKFRGEDFSFDLKWSFPFGRFEKRREIHKGEEIFDSREEPIQVGKLLIPYYNIKSREKMEKLLQAESTSCGSYIEALAKFPNSKRFYSWGMSYEPIDENILILNEAQLIR